MAALFDMDAAGLDAVSASSPGITRPGGAQELVLAPDALELVRMGVAANRDGSARG